MSDCNLLDSDPLDRDHRCKHLGSSQELYPSLNILLFDSALSASTALKYIDLHTTKSTGYLYRSKRLSAVQCQVIY